jgi:hypothetical protein
MFKERDGPIIPAFALARIGPLVSVHRLSPSLILQVEASSPQERSDMRESKIPDIAALIRATS